MIRGICFDFDGVLVESVEIKTRAFAVLFAPEGPDIVRQVLAHHRAHLGISRMEKIRHAYQRILRRPLSAHRLGALCERFARLVVEAVVAAPWVTGAPEVFDACRQRGQRLFVVSGTPQDELRMILRRRGAVGYFDGVYGAPARKPELLRRILRRERLISQELLFIGDAQTDYNAARAVGVEFFARGATREDAKGWSRFGVTMVRDFVGLDRRVRDMEKRPRASRSSRRQECLMPDDR